MKKPKGLPPPLEKDIQKSILDYLELRHVPHWRANTGAAWLPGRGGKPQLVRFGFRGVSDILGILPPSGRWLAIEVKRPGKEPTADQKWFLTMIRDNGGLVIVAHSVEDVIRGFAK